MLILSFGRWHGRTKEIIKNCHLFYCSLSLSMLVAALFATLFATLLAAALFAALFPWSAEILAFVEFVLTSFIRDLHSARLLLGIQLLCLLE